MKTLLTVATLAAFSVATNAALAEPVKLSKAQLDQVVAGAIEQTNGGGNVPNGNANGIPASNPAGNEPPGQNKP